SSGVARLARPRRRRVDTLAFRVGFILDLAPVAHAVHVAVARATDVHQGRECLLAEMDGNGEGRIGRELGAALGAQRTQASREGGLVEPKATFRTGLLNDGLHATLPCGPVHDSTARVIYDREVANSINEIRGIAAVKHLITLRLRELLS